MAELIGKDRLGPKSSGDMADIVDLMLATGAWIGEVLAIRWKDVDLDRGGGSSTTWSTAGGRSVRGRLGVGAEA